MDYLPIVRFIRLGKPVKTFLDWFRYKRKTEQNKDNYDNNQLLHLVPLPKGFYF